MVILVILSFATLAVSVAVQTSSTPTHPPATAVPTSFVGSALTNCMRSCVADAANASSHCYGAGMCGCTDPKVQKAVAACLQSRCSFTKEVALQLQHGTKCYRQIGGVSESSSVVSVRPHAGPDHLTYGFPPGVDDPIVTSSLVSSSTSNSSSEASSSMTKPGVDNSTITSNREVPSSTYNLNSSSEASSSMTEPSVDDPTITSSPEVPSSTYNLNSSSKASSSMTEPSVDDPTITSSPEVPSFTSNLNSSSEASSSMTDPPLR